MSDYSKTAMTSTGQWGKGEMHGISFPADAETLLSDGPGFLSRAFHASGVLTSDNQVARIVHAEEFFGGGTGRKLVLDVEYQLPGSDLPTQLFIKFSRHFSDELRDSVRFMMVSEAKFAVLSSGPDFPVTVPTCLFADIEAGSGTGLIITERIAFGHNGLEPLYPKCMDYRVPEPLEHYKAILKAQAKLAGTHCAGGLSAEFDQHFPYNRKQAEAMVSLRSPEEKLLQRAARMFEFIERYPQLFPDTIRDKDFQQQFLADIPAVVAAETRIISLLNSNEDFIAFCHWNANIDNCWFWRDSTGGLQCGMLDWAMVGKMNVAQAVSGIISGAESFIWEQHLDELLQWFVDQFAEHGGPELDVAELRLQIFMLLAVAGLSYYMSAPLAITREITNLDEVSSYQHEAFQQHENARIQLHMMTKLLNIWQQHQLGDLVRQLTL